VRKNQQNLYGIGDAVIGRDQWRQAEVLLNYFSINSDAGLR
jgi:hypothetical protein